MDECVGFTSLKANLAEPFFNAAQTQITGTIEESHHLTNTCILINLIS
jgi:hypothetical protein